jgi:predicted SAM-dependent methyltransferase
MKLSIGAGDRRIPGWVHVDNDPKTDPDMLVDISGPLPFGDNTIECILCEEVVTQISLESCQQFLFECRRIIQKNGVVRVSTPDLRLFSEAYLNRQEWLLEIWEEQVGLPLTTGTAAEIFNTGMRAVGPFVYDEQTLTILAKAAGFFVYRRSQNESCHPAMQDIDLRSEDRTVSMFLDLVPN